MLLRLYGAFTRLVQPLVRRKLRRRAVAEPGYAVAVEERFGHYEPLPADAEGLFLTNARASHPRRM